MLATEPQLKVQTSFKTGLSMSWKSHQKEFLWVLCHPRRARQAFKHVVTVIHRCHFRFCLKLSPTEMQLKHWQRKHSLRSRPVLKPVLVRAGKVIRKNFYECCITQGRQGKHCSDCDSSLWLAILPQIVANGNAAKTLAMETQLKVQTSFKTGLSMSWISHQKEFLWVLRHPRQARQA